MNEQITEEAFYQEYDQGGYNLRSKIVAPGKKSLVPTKRVSPPIKNIAAPGKRMAGPPK